MEGKKAGGGEAGEVSAMNGKESGKQASGRRREINTDPPPPTLPPSVLSPSLLSAPLHPPRFSLSPKEQVGVREGLG